MARSLNKVMIIGRLGREPEMKYTPSGEPVTNFSVATTRTWTDQASNERREVTDWHNVVAWRRLAEQCKEYLAKGSLVYLEGRLETRSWDDRDSGKKMYRTEIVLDQMNMLDSRSDRDTGDGDGDDDRASRPVRRASTPPATRPDGQSRPADTRGAGLRVVPDDNPFDLDDTPF